MKKFTRSLLCLITALVTGSINAVAPLQILSVVSRPTACFDPVGAPSGSLIVTLTGGTEPYMVTITSSALLIPITKNGLLGQTTFIFNDLPVGTYDIVATDMTTPSHLEDTATFNVPSFSPIEITSASFGHPTCAGADTGSITINVEGGPAPATTYLYNITPPVNTTLTPDGASHTFLGLAAGDYTVLVLPLGATLDNTTACAAKAEIALVAPAALTVVQTGGTRPTCNGGSDGSFIVTVAGGVPPYTVTLNDVTQIGTATQTVFTFTGLAAGYYYAFVTDSNNCVASGSGTILPQQTVLTISEVKVVPATCPTSSNGSLTILVNNELGATLNYMVTGPGGVIYGPQVSSTFTGLPVGNYIVQAEAVPAPIPPLCAVAPATITSPSAVVISLAITNQDIVNDILGSIVATVTGGTPPYTVTLTPGGLPPIVGTATQTVFTFNNLVAGTYLVTAVDVNGCTTSDPGIVLCVRGQSTNPITNFITALCKGGCTIPA